MGIKNVEYNRIRLKYEEQQMKNNRLLSRRRQKIYDLIPAYRQLEERIISLSVQNAKASLFDEDAPSSYLQEMEELFKEKSELLIRNGFPADFLEPAYLCPDCRDTGYIGNEKCHCFKQEIVTILYEQANLGTILESENFRNFRLDLYSNDIIEPTLGITPYQNMLRILSDCKNFTADFDSTYANLLLYGNTGVGKTFLANCIAKELLDSAHTVVYLTAFELFDILEKNKFSKSYEEKGEMNEKFHYILNCDLLIIDDLGTELINSFSASQIYLCINERHLSQKSTIISTNLSLDDIKNLYSERVFSRIISDYRLKKIIGEDIRLKKAFSP